uniref:Uncharacterized protein n=1 Tax=Rhizophora mucronata TaxID=61149 RepID=A0A2P2IIF5_RHIMU
MPQVSCWQYKGKIFSRGVRSWFQSHMASPMM